MVPIVLVLAGPSVFARLALAFVNVDVAAVASVAWLAEAGEHCNAILAVPIMARVWVAFVNVHLTMEAGKTWGRNGIEPQRNLGSGSLSPSSHTTHDTTGRLPGRTRWRPPTPCGLLEHSSPTSCPLAYLLVFQRNPNWSQYGTVVTESLARPVRSIDLQPATLSWPNIPPCDDR